VARGREIIYSTAFDQAVEKIGGYRSIDVSLDTILDALYRNPYGFNKFESDFVSFRYAITKSTDWLPALIVIFTIAENGNVTLEHVEEHLS
jgi:hypothetical protein